MANKQIIAYIVRHGQEEEPGNIFNSWIDAPLTQEGMKQEREIAEYLRRVDIKIIYSSPLKRALRTAEAINKNHHVDVVQDRGLLGWGLGVFSGLPHEIGEDAIDLFVKNPDVVIPNGESLNISIKRIHDFASKMLKKMDQDHIGVFVTHGHDIAILEGLMNGTAFDSKPKAMLEVGGVAAVYLDGDEYSMEGLLHVKAPDAPKEQPGTLVTMKAK